MIPTRAQFEGAVNRGVLHLARYFSLYLIVGVGAMVALTIVGPLAAERFPTLSWGIHLLFKLSCHQMPERCLVIGPGLAPVCARLSGDLREPVPHRGDPGGPGGSAPDPAVATGGDVAADVR